jgi:hypothetical protein
MHWYELFDTLAERQLAWLRKLEIASTQQIGENINKLVGESEVKKMHELLVEDSKRRPFAYVNLDDKYGILTQDEEEEVESLLQGEDQKAYDRLVAVVEGNREKGNMPADPAA